MRRATRRWLVGTSCLAAAALVGAGYVAAIDAIRDFEPFRFGSDREHLDEIPISGAACRSVVAIHAAANDFQLAYTSAVLGFDARQQQSTWPVLRNDVDRTALALETAIEEGIPVFPRPARRQLRKVRAALGEGRTRLGAVPDFEQLDRDTGGLFEAGQEHFGLAGDLVGDQCAVPLRADDDSAFLGHLSEVPGTTSSPH